MVVLLDKATFSGKAANSGIISKGSTAVVFINVVRRPTNHGKAGIAGNRRSTIGNPGAVARHFNVSPSIGSIIHIVSARCRRKTNVREPRVTVHSSAGSIPAWLVALLLHVDLFPCTVDVPGFPLHDHFVVACLDESAATKGGTVITDKHTHIGTRFRVVPIVVPIAIVRLDGTGQRKNEKDQQGMNGISHCHCECRGVEQSDANADAMQWRGCDCE